MGGILKSFGELFLSLFGLDKLGKTEEAEDMKDSFNDIVKTLGITSGPVFQTKKVKAAEERREREAMRQAQEETARNTAAQAQALQDLLDEIRKRP